MSSFTGTTKLIMSAAHLYPQDFKDELKERMEHPYKSSTPEFGVDLESIRRELEDAKGRHLAKSIFLFIVSVVGFFIFLQNPEDNGGILILALFLAAIAELVYLKAAKNKVRKIMGVQSTETDSDDEASHESTKKNVVISGGYSPFIGAGFDMDSWSFTVDLGEPEDKNLPVGKVTAAELHNNIVEKLRALHIDDMTVTDELFVNGQDVNLLLHLLPEGRMTKPLDCVDQAYILSRINSNDKRERHYRVVRVPMWDGQLVLSMYYRFLVVNKNLFTEARFFILPPLKTKFLDINNMAMSALSVGGRQPPESKRFHSFFPPLFQRRIGGISWPQHRASPTPIPPRPPLSRGG